MLSLASGYTAGNQYRLQQILGSLTLGGYDTSLFIVHKDQFSPFNQIDDRALTVTVSRIRVEARNSSSTVLGVGHHIAALIDSTVPNMYLPHEICEEIGEAFGLT